MADAKAIYEQFLLTPLKLKQQQQEEEADADVDGVAGALTFDLASETDEEERERGAGDDRARLQRAAPVHASPKLERLRGRIASADLSDEERPAAASRTRRRGSARQSTGSDTKTDTPRRAQKKKRVTRSVVIANARSGGEWVDTPSKASRPSKRSRVSAETDKENRDDASDSAAAEAALALVSRRITDRFEGMNDAEAGEHADQEDGAATSSSSTSLSSPSPSVAVSCSSSSKATKAVRSTTASRPVRRSRRLAHQFSDQEDPETSPPPPVVDLLTPLCDALIATNTISGLLFALSLNALRSLGHSVQPPVRLLVLSRL